MKSVITSSLKSSKVKYDKQRFKTDPEYRNDICYMVALMDQQRYF